VGARGLNEKKFVSKRYRGGPAKRDKVKYDRNRKPNEGEGTKGGTRVKNERLQDSRYKLIHCRGKSNRGWGTILGYKKGKKKNELKDSS